MSETFARRTECVSVFAVAGFTLLIYDHVLTVRPSLGSLPPLAKTELSMQFSEEVWPCGHVRFRPVRIMIVSLGELDLEYTVGGRVGHFPAGEHPFMILGYTEIFTSLSLQNRYLV